MHLKTLQSCFSLASLTVLTVCLATGGCHKATHPDEKSAVDSSLKSNNLGDVNTSQDREKGVLTLSGNVNSDDLKSQAEQLAKQAAPDYVIANQIGVRPPGEPNAGAVASSLDSGIEDNFKATLKAHENLNDQSIHYSVKNGALTLSGSVKTDSQKKQAEDLAKHVPNVEQVINELEVKPTKHSTPN